MRSKPYLRPSPCPVPSLQSPVTQPLASTATGIATCESFLARGLPEVDFIKTNMSGKRYRIQSIAWEHFRESDLSKDEVICDYCGEKLKRGGGTSNMFKHLERKHPARIPGRNRARLDSESRSSLPPREPQEEEERVMYECPEDTDAGPSTSQSSSRPIRPKPVQVCTSPHFAQILRYSQFVAPRYCGLARSSLETPFVN